MFINNKFEESTSNNSYLGGAIYNAGHIEEIVADFIGNYVSGYSGAIYNDVGGIIGNITGDFIGNAASYYGVIYNYNAIIGNITGDFIGNAASYGGAIYNEKNATIGNITGDFIGNSSRSYGGAIYNNDNATIGNITGSFIGNTASSGYGGAIYNYNNATIGNITGDFIGNTNSGYGGAIYNSRSVVGDITGNFIGNSANSAGVINNWEGGRIGNIIGNFIGNSAKSYAGAIYNQNAQMGDITGDFIGNYSSSGNGGAIYNGAGGIGNITGNFIGNTANNYNGGAIYNSGITSYFQGGSSSTETARIGNITGNFIGNTGSYGGAIYNDRAIIGDITGDFVGNSANFDGGAIVNYSVIGNIVGDFIGNSAEKYGGAIVNYGLIGNITGDFIGNTTHYYSGAIYSSAKIGNITGDFVRNSSNDYAGAVMLRGYVGDISGNFIGNISAYSYGSGAIYNGGAGIGNITGDFIGNSSNGYSGAIYNQAGIGATNGGIINSNFINNSVISQDSGKAKGGAICTTQGLSIIADNGTSTFKGNYVQAKDGEINHQAIYVDSTSANLALTTRNDGVINMHDYIDGREGYTVNITGDESGTLNLYNDIKNANVVADTIKVNLADGNTHNYEFYSLNSDSKAKYVLDIDFENRTSDKITTTNESSGVVTIESLRILNDLTTDSGNDYKIQILDTQTDALQLALSEELKSQLSQKEYKIGVSAEDIFDEVKATTSWNDKYSVFEQQTDIYGTMNLATTNTTNDSIGISVSRTEAGELVFKESMGDTLALWAGLDTEEVKNFNFGSEKDVYEVGKDNPETLGLGEVKGSELNINGVLEGEERSTLNLNNRKGFKISSPTILNIKNLILTKGVDENGSAINVTDSDSTVNLTNVSLVKNISSEKGGAIYSNSNVNITADNATSEITNNYSGSKNEAIYIANADKTLTLKAINNGKLTLNDSINGENGYKVDITGDSTGTLNLYNDIYNANVSLGNINLNTINGLTHEYNFNSLTLSGNTNMLVDVDLANAQMDRLTTSSYGKHQGNLNVVGMNILSDAKEDITSILFADNGLKDNVTTTVKEVAYSPIYKYDVTYNNTDDGGFFVFGRSASGGNASEVYNPSVLSSPVSNVAASQSTVNETFHYVFAHADAFTKLPSLERSARLNANKYALSSDFNENTGRLYYDHNNQGVWFRPYVTFENMNLKNGPRVNSISYGSLVGFDTDIKEHEKGWYSVGTGYIGYNGSQLSYNGVNTSMNGGLAGYTHTNYRGNFWSALTLSAGANVGESRTMYGKEDFTSLMAGLGSKTGYNFEFKEGKYILQPIMFMSYTFVNTFDYTNAAGVKIKPSPAHSIQLNPSVRFVTNTKNGWQPYASVGMVWNVFNSNKVMANSVRLPEMSMKPYVEYGVGIQRNWKDKFIAYGQAMLRNGGCNGVSLTFGFRWALGREHDNL